MAALRSRLHQGAEIPIDASERFEQRLGELAGAPIARDAVGEGAGLPVLARLPDALAAAVEAAPDLAEPLAQMSPSLRWTQSYRERPPSPDFLSRYGYAQFAGPDNVPTLITSDRLALGVLMLAPGTVYPTHAHPAEEIYLPLAAARWQRGTEAWRERQGGDLVHHPSGMVHATEAGALPLLALYIWLGDLATGARILGA
ncbi:dimethylsulfonioproprionate lyase family protein [Hypericibacter adhaerens]|uniref:dimethylsulfonioproprionate lyase family protein n=1 Tax=Hypericibacter adhaerens TaxID=2602016 RepID=UPI002D7E749B|nr:dimethylsulfonioproprionate lyase family protein [Hypericibacter adhaerens]